MSDFMKTNTYVDRQVEKAYAEFDQHFASANPKNFEKLLELIKKVSPLMYQQLAQLDRQESLSTKEERRELAQKIKASYNNKLSLGLTITSGILSIGSGALGFGGMGAAIGGVKEAILKPIEMATKAAEYSSQGVGTFSKIPDNLQEGDRSVLRFNLEDSKRDSEDKMQQSSQFVSNRSEAFRSEEQREQALHEAKRQVMQNNG